MTMIDRDQLLRIALTPKPDVVVPADLGDVIVASLAGTPQRGAGWTAPLGRRLPGTPAGARQVVLWATLLLLLVATIAIIGVASQRMRSVPPDIVSYRGHPSQDGVLRGPAPVGTPGIAWQIDLGGPMTILGLPLVRDGVAWFVDTRGHVVAVDAATGGQRWAKNGPGLDSPSPVLLGPTLVVVGNDGSVAAFDAETGDPRWSRSLGIDVNAPLAGVDATVFVSSSDGSIHALHAADGSDAYTVLAGGPVNRSPAIADGVAYVVADTGVATAFDVATGGSIWTTNLAVTDPQPLLEPEALTPVVADGTIYVTRGGKEVAIPHDLVAIDAVTGKVRWRKPSTTLDRFFVGAATDDRIYTVSEDGTVWSFAPDGTDSRKLTQAAGAIGAPAAVVGDELFVTSADGMVQALDRHDGTQHWAVKVDGTPTMPVVADGRVLVGTSLGKAVAIAAP